MIENLSSEVKNLQEFIDLMKKEAYYISKNLEKYDFDSLSSEIIRFAKRFSKYQVQGRKREIELASERCMHKAMEPRILVIPEENDEDEKATAEKGTQTESFQKTPKMGSDTSFASKNQKRKMKTKSTTKFKDLISPPALDDFSSSEHNFAPSWQKSSGMPVRTTKYLIDNHILKFSVQHCRASKSSMNHHKVAGHNNNSSVDLMKHRKESQRRDQQQGSAHQSRKFYSSYDAGGWLDTFSNRDSHHTSQNHSRKAELYGGSQHVSASPLPEIKDYVEIPGRKLQ